MHRLLVISIALAIGCRDEAIEQLEDIKTVVCGCKTARCAEAAMGVVTLTKAKSNPRSQRIARDMLDCLAKLYAKESAGPDAPAGEEAEETGSAAGTGSTSGSAGSAATRGSAIPRP